MDYNCRYQFPDPELVDPEGEGLVALGGDLAPDTLLSAYQQGLFPWFNEGDPIAWWSPEPRCIIYPAAFSPSKSLKRLLKSSQWTVTINQSFKEVIHACAEVRAYANGTWISPAIIQAYNQLHNRGNAYSIEVWENHTLIGGLYGLKIGQAFFGESMFHRKTDASKVAFFVLMQLCKLSKFPWVDCQLPNQHLLNLGASILPRRQFLTSLSQQINQPSCDWSLILKRPILISELVIDDKIFYTNHKLLLKSMEL